MDGYQWVVDADLRDYFGSVEHEKLIDMVAEKVSDGRVLSLIRQMLKAGCMEEGKYLPSPKGTPQGGVISPMLANVYLHYVLDLWFTVKIKRECRGESYLGRYCDDFLCFFQYQDDAEAFYGKLIDRLRKFNLEIAEEKTKIIEFGRFAEERRSKRGKGKPETFDFLGFTHYCSKSKNSNFRVKRKISRKKFKAKLKDFAEWLHENMHTEIGDLIKQINAKLVGHYRCYGITDNSNGIRAFGYRIRRKLFEILNRRSQKKSLTWEGFAKLEERFPLAKARIYVNIYG